MSKCLIVFQVKATGFKRGIVTLYGELFNMLSIQFKISFILSITKFDNHKYFRKLFKLSTMTFCGIQRCDWNDKNKDVFPLKHRQCVKVYTITRLHISLV